MRPSHIPSTAGSGLDRAIEKAISEVGGELGIYAPAEVASTEDSPISESLESAILSALSGIKTKED